MKNIKNLELANVTFTKPLDFSHSFDFMAKVNEYIKAVNDANAAASLAAGQYDAANAELKKAVTARDAAIDKAIKAAEAAAAKTGKPFTVVDRDAAANAAAEEHKLASYYADVNKAEEAKKAAARDKRAAARTAAKYFDTWHLHDSYVLGILAKDFSKTGKLIRRTEKGNAVETNVDKSFRDSIKAMCFAEHIGNAGKSKSILGLVTALDTVIGARVTANGYTPMNDITFYRLFLSVLIDYNVLADNWERNADGTIKESAAAEAARKEREAKKAAEEAEKAKNAANAEANAAKKAAAKKDAAAIDKAKEDAAAAKKDAAKKAAK